MTTTTNSRSGEKGFTLVELSIVMIIIGLLIGGILKGQELIANARLAAAISKVKAVDAALNTFRDSFNGIPGDLPSTRLPNCLAGTVCAVAVAAPDVGMDGRIGNPTGQSTGTGQTADLENVRAWAQLAAVDLIGGVSNVTSGGNIESGVTVPSADIPGQMYLGYEASTAVPVGYAGGAVGTATAARAGHYILIHQGITGPTGTSAAAAAATTGSLLATQVSRIDTKLDDGKPNSGSVLAMGAASAAGCSTATGDPGIYNMAATTAVCGAYVRIQQ